VEQIKIVVKIIYSLVGMVAHMCLELVYDYLFSNRRKKQNSTSHTRIQKGERKFTIPLTEIIARNRKAIESIVGRAEKIQIKTLGGSLTCLKAYYHKGEVVIFYIDNVADWIIIYNKKNRNTIDFICYFGLTDLTATYDYCGTTTYTDRLGLKEIKTITLAGIPQLVHIKTFTQ
jgi:hypothetical protein